MLTRAMTVLPLLVTPLLPLALPLTARAQTSTVQTTNQLRVVAQTEETLYFNPDTAYELPLVVESATTINGRQFPAGTVIQGRLDPVSGGLQYTATGIAAGGLVEPFAALSDLLPDVKDPRETSGGAIATDAAIGAAGGAVLGAVIGDGVNWWEILGGAAAGVAVGNVTAQRVVIVEPDVPIVLNVPTPR
ncbi:hypothetical protein [Leptolyngbya iicbica]|uniref:hypothetical protein n=1 Tax=Leptolyngbya iicbica TaxID=3161580 RepID=UPI0005858D92|nr:hypothetical protein [Leptolyngbya sp. LK]